jgi:hypothetical protein
MIDTSLRRTYAQPFSELSRYLWALLAGRFVPPQSFHKSTRKARSQRSDRIVGK